MLFPYDYLIVPGCTLALVYLYFQQKTAAPKRTIPVPMALSKKKGITEDDDEDESLQPITIFFASQTGTAEEFSKQLARESKGYHFRARVVDMEEYVPDDLENESLAVFVLATYGEGEPTDNSRDFHNWLLADERDPGCLSNLKFVVFGLGNKTYEHFNAMARIWDARLEELGAARLFDRGEGDDDGSLEEDFLAWKDQMWPGLCEQLGISADGGDQVSRSFKMIVHDPDELPEFSRERSGSHSMRLAVDARVLVNRELHGETSDRSCRHIEVDCTQHGLQYEAGDHLAVFPVNREDLIAQYAERLDIDLDVQFSLVPASDDGEKSHYPSPCTLRDAFSRFMDIQGMATKNAIRIFAEYAEDPVEKERLMVLAGSSDVSRAEYGTYVKKGMRNALEVLEDFPSVKIPIDHFLEAMPPLQSRYYSISSSPKASAKTVHITAVLSEFTTPSNVTKYGVCTNYLQSATPDNNSLVKVYIRKSTFRLPTDTSKPVIMVGPGTGLAPFRGFLQDRDADMHTHKDRHYGELVLFFGCRDRTKDFLYDKELLDYAKRGVLHDLELAFSREGAKKVYVQHKIAAKKDLVYDLLVTKKGFLYICGEGSRMAKDVQATILDIFEGKGMSPAEAKKTLDDMKSDNRMQMDVWS